MRILSILLLLLASALNGAEVPRRVLGLYDSRLEKTPTDTFLHKICEMPLNYLGLDLLYHDIREPLPNLAGRSDIRGVLTCFPYQMAMDDPAAYLQWAESVVDSGKKFVILRDPGFKLGPNHTFTAPYLMNSFYEKLGIQERNDWTQYTFNYQIIDKDLALVEFEHPYPTPLPPFSTFEIIDPKIKSYLTVGQINDPETNAELVLIGPKGGLVSQFYDSTYTKEEQPTEARYWYIDPFKFFQLSFGLENFPAADTTTLAGRRIFFNQIDGDGWNSLSELEGQDKKQLLCPEVIYRDILTKYPHLPASLSLIGADIDPNWVGTKKSQEMAQHLLAQGQVEIACHTYSHPFDWQFFQKKDQQDKEIQFLHLYPYGTWQSSYLSWLRGAYYMQRGKIAMNENSLGIGYVTPRAYANQPFDLAREIEGATGFINSLAPEGKAVKIFQWCGNYLPWGEPIKMTRQMDLKNLNGGSVRKDYEKASYCDVAPLGRKVDGQIQIYACSDNENAYTSNWTNHFYAFKYLVETFKNTETPRRIKLIDLYYHVYTAEKIASLNALHSNLSYIESQEIIPVWPSRYAACADGFYTLIIEELAPNKWQIKNRGDLQTIRFDNAELTVDYAASEGVVGHRIFQDALYIYLDAAHLNPIIGLGKESRTPYLVESRWEVFDVHRTPSSIECTTSGWGDLEMQWHLPQAAGYRMRVSDTSYEANALLVAPSIYQFKLPISGKQQPLHIVIERVDSR